MDTQTDSAAFKALLDQLCAAFDRPPAKDEMVQAFWHALRDVKFSEVTANAQRIMRTAIRETKFPRPAELRNVAPHEVAASGEAKFREGEMRAVANLEELRREDPVRWRNDVWLRRLDLILAAEPESSPIYAQALAEARRLRPLVRGY